MQAQSQLKGPVTQSQAAHHRGREARKPAPGPDAKEMLAEDFPFRGLPHLFSEFGLALGGRSVSPGLDKHFIGRSA